MVIKCGKRRNEKTHKYILRIGFSKTTCCTIEHVGIDGIDGIDYFTHHRPLLSSMLGIRHIVTMVTLIHFSSVIPKLHVHKAYVKKNYIIIERNAIQSY